MNHREAFAIYLTKILFCGMSLCAVTGHAQTKPIVDLRVDTFNTGLQTPGFTDWIDSNWLVMDVPEAGVGYEEAAQEIETRVALINFQKKSVRYIASHASIYDYDRKTRTLLINEKHSTDPSCSQRNCNLNLREVRVESNGTVTEIRRWAYGERPPSPSDAWPVRKGFQPLDQGKDGYLLHDLSPGDTYIKQDERLSKNDEGYPTTWIRSDQPPLPLPIRFDEIFNGVYLEFMDAYLLDTSDTSMSSATNSHSFGPAWRRPYEYTPFRLLKKTGEIEEISYPQFVFDFGIAKRQWVSGTGSNFSKFLPTRAGIVITTGRPNNRGIYLFKNDQLYRVAGGDRLIGVASASADRISLFKLSPDGCKIAYSHLNRSAEEMFLETKGYLPRVLTIINVCKN